MTSDSPSSGPQSQDPAIPGHEYTVHEHDLCFVDGELVISAELLARIEQAPPVRCVCSGTPTDLDREMWRVCVMREAITHRMHGNEHLPVVGIDAGYPTFLCGCCSELMATGQLRPLARRLLKPWMPMASPRGGAYDQTITEMVLWLIKVRDNSDLITHEEWAGRVLGEDS